MTLRNLKEINLSNILQGRTRSQGRKENVVVVKKVRGRVRQTTTTTEEPETTRRTVAIRTRTPYNRNTNRESTRDRVNESEEVVKEKVKFEAVYLSTLL